MSNITFPFTNISIENKISIGILPKRWWEESSSRIKSNRIRSRQRKKQRFCTFIKSFFPSAQIFQIISLVERSTFSLQKLPLKLIYPKKKETISYNQRNNQQKSNIKTLERSKFSSIKTERFIPRTARKEKIFLERRGIIKKEKSGIKGRHKRKKRSRLCWDVLLWFNVLKRRWLLMDDEAEEKGWHISTWAFLKEENRKSRLVARMLSKPLGPPLATGIIGGGGSASATAILRFVSPQRPHNQQQQQQQVRELSPAT